MIKDCMPAKDWPVGLPPEVARNVAQGIGAGIADAIFRTFTETTKVTCCGDCPFEPGVPNLKVEPSCTAPRGAERWADDTAAARKLGGNPDPVSAHMQPGSGVPRWCPLRAGTVRVALRDDVAPLPEPSPSEAP